MGKERKPNLRISRIPSKASARAFERVLQEGLVRSRLLVPAGLFEETLAKLHQRGEEERESAAIWSGRILGDDWEPSRVDFHHELCDDRATALSLELSEAAKFRLYQTLAASQLRLVSLIHTHPQDWVDLSQIDRENQMCSRVGFWSLVIPNYGRPPWLLTEMGIHTRTEKGWYRLTKAETQRMVIIKE